MKQNNFILNIRHRMFYLLCVFLFALSFSHRVQAQNGAYLTWSQQVGCVEYGNKEDEKDEKRLYLTEDIQNTNCVRVCENSLVTYNVLGSNVTNVVWTATGGSVNATYGTANANANIQWGVAGSGIIGLTITYADNSVQNLSVCIEKILGPHAEFQVYGISPDPVYCLNTDIFFQNLSSANGGSDLYSYLWNFGDGSFSSAFEPSHSYTQSGNYTVTLKVYNLCNCQSEFSFDIKIEDKPLVAIYCPSIVCENEIATYTSSDQCGGEWEVTGGSITNNTGTSIDVKWDSVGPDGFGTVNYRSSCLCPFWTTIKVPVILIKVPINGPENICVGDQGVFSLPQWPTTDFTWTLTAANPPTTTTLVYTDQRNEIVVNALEPGDYLLQCNYKNTLVGCEGYGEIKFKVGQGLEISGDNVVCSGSVHTYHNSENTPVTWTLSQNNTVITSVYGPAFNYNFPNAGTFTLSLENNASNCETTPFVINVYQTPAAPVGPIVGEQYICPGSPYQYSAANTVPGTVLSWSVTGGTIQGSSSGNNVVILFNATGPYAVSVARKSATYPGCESAPLTKTVLPIVPNAVITNNEGLSIFCPSSETTFTATFPNFTPDYIEWTIAGGFGNVISGGNTPTVTVNWNEIQNNTPTGTLTIHIKVCGTDYYFNKSITLYQLPTLTLDLEDHICYGENIPAHLVINATSPVTSGTITWDFGNGVTQTTPINPTGNYSLNNPYNNNTGGNVSYTILATLNSPNGCSYQPQASDSIIIYPRTTINVSPGYNYIVCPATYNGTITLHANAITGLNLTVTYQWYKGGTPISGATASDYTIPAQTATVSPGGTYFVRVTDSNGCVVNSQNIYVTEDCTTGNGCTIPANANISLTATWSACNTITANLSYNGSATVSWIHGPLETITSSNNYGAQYYTDVPGVHLIRAYLTFQTANGPCTTYRDVEVDTRYKPNFNYTIACNGNGTGYNVTLFDNSTVFNIAPPTTLTYLYTSSGFSNQNTPTAMYNNLAPGTYNFTMQVSLPGQPVCSVTKTVVLSPLPTASFAALDSFYCAESPITLTITNYNPANTYKWLFAGTSIYASGPTTLINIPIQNVYQVTLVESSPFGCTAQNTSANFNIIKAEFFGAYLSVSNSPACEGDTPGAAITYINGFGTPPHHYDWMKGNQVIISNTTNSTFYPPETGSYWAIAYDINGCKNINATSVPVIIKPKPPVSVSGDSTLCNGESGTIHGIAPLNNMEYRWLINGSPAVAPYGSWSATTPLNITVDTSNSGTFTYTLEVRPLSSTSCGNSASTTVTVYPPVVQPTLSYSIVTCEPYLVKVNASGPAGVYNWSNGDSGATALTTTGGAIGVTYTDSNGCQSTNTITVPHPLQSLMWTIPSGCYDICLTANPASYVLAPSPVISVVDHFEWLINGATVLSGTNSTVSNIAVTQAGTYQLNIDKDGCFFESNTFSVSPSFEECSYNDCKLRTFIKSVKYKNGVYEIAGYIINPNPFSITISLSSFNNYGTYVPATVTIPAGGTFNFPPLQFVPNPGFIGGDDVLVIQSSELNCIQVTEIKFPKYAQTKMADSYTDSTVAGTALQVAPNPAVQNTLVVYSLGSEYKNAEKLIVYSILGTPVKEIKLDKPAGNIELQTSGLASGSYIISIIADGQNALQKVLIVK